MEIKADSRIPFPRQVVFESYRDELPLLVPYLPNITSIVVLKREEEAPGVTRLLNLWKAKGDVPKVAQAVIKPEMLEWNDHAKWDQNEWTCEWRVELKLFTDAVKCGGKNRFVVDGENTKLEIRGNLEVDLKKIPGVPKFLAGTIAPVVEKFIVTLLTPNLTSVSDGLEKYLRQKKT